MIQLLFKNYRREIFSESESGAGQFRSKKFRAKLRFGGPMGNRTPTSSMPWMCSTTEL
ncbi:MAG: hypothetical protein UT97_C0030G0002 [Parcubacteria group bacterium GW2011_GWC2_40_31]|nr:MAG: hypothetical protein UT97_C0030G0002 [Parcubacteria group bacterium GW2011_GWC2_40_31]